MTLLGKMADRPSSPSPAWVVKKLIKRYIVLAAALTFALSILRLYRPAHRKPKLEGPPILTWPQVQEPYDAVTTSEFRPVAMDPRNTIEELCESFPRHLLETIQPILRTGFLDPPARMPTQFDSVSACFQPGDLLIFSDAPDTIHGHEVIDILANLPDTYHEFSDFQPYLELARLRDNGTAEANPESLESIDGWRLDKFKFLPEIEQAWLRKPNRDFYVFYESDT